MSGKKVDQEMGQCEHDDYVQCWLGYGLIRYECLDCGEIIKTTDKESWDWVVSEPLSPEARKAALPTTDWSIDA